MNNLIIIPARKNSVRLKNKNLLKIRNKTLIEHTIIFAKKILPTNNILVTTDSDKIRNIAIKKKILCPWLRPKKLSNSEATSDSVILHALNWYEKRNSLVDFIILLQPTSPFRSKKTYLSCINKAKKNPDCTIITFKNKKKKIFLNKKNRIYEKIIKYLVPNGSIYIISGKKFKKSKKLYSGVIKPEIVMSEKENIDIDYKKDYINAKKFF